MARAWLRWLFGTKAPPQIAAAHSALTYDESAKRVASILAMGLPEDDWTDNRSPGTAPALDARDVKLAQPILKVVSPQEAVDFIIRYLNEWGPRDLVTANELALAWRATAKFYGLSGFDCQNIWEEFARLGLKVGKSRLNAPGLIHIRERTGSSRAVLYRIPRRGPANAVGPAPGPVGPASEPALRPDGPSLTTVRLESESALRRKRQAPGAGPRRVAS